MPHHNPERVAAFDKIITSSHDLLTNVAVRRRLGREKTAQLGHLVHGAFLPNIYHDRVELPRGRYSTDDIPVIPLVADDMPRGLRLNGSMYMPTQSRYEKIHADLQARYGMTRYQSRNLVFDAVPPLHELIDPDLHRMSTKLKARTSAAAEELEDGLLLSPRPHVVFGVGRTRQSTIGTGAAALHEFTHVADAEQLMEMPVSTEDWFVYSELKAGEVTHACLEGAGVIADEVVVDPAIVHGEGFLRTLAIERLRRRVNPADNPYARHPELTATVLQAQLPHAALSEA